MALKMVWKMPAIAETMLLRHEATAPIFECGLGEGDGCWRCEGGCWKPGWMDGWLGR